MSQTHRPARLVGLMLGGFGALLLCAILCGELLKHAERPGGSTGFDSSITAWMVAHRSSAWTALARGLSTVGSQVVLTPVAVAVAAVLLLRRRLVPSASLVAAWGGAILLYTLTKDFVERPRPPSAIWLTNVGKTTSYPSGHATQSLATFAALALVAAACTSRAAWPGRVLAVVLAAGVGWSRVYLGVHWTTDVIAGWLIAAAWVAIVSRLARAQQS
ncbi:MAG TPA: phosphatase PAP2 family protein [Solirubrobacteraceae bacterium]|nr:phosphatase PAP2 family protein [Solirubrobacteraceae bacterium]